MSWLSNLASRLGFGRKKLSYPHLRPTVVDLWTRGTADVGKVPTLPHLGFRFIYEIYLFSDLLRLTIRSLVQETVRKGIGIRPRFAVKCTVCGHEYDVKIDRCTTCKSTSLREPSFVEKQFVEQFIKDVNYNDQTLVEVLAEIDTDLNLYDNAFLAVVKEYSFNSDGEVVGARVKEVLRLAPETVELIMDNNGLFGRADDGSVVMTCLRCRHREYRVREEEAETARCVERLEDGSVCGLKLYPAYFRIRKTLGVTSQPYIYYVNGEILHGKKFTHGFGYGVSPVLSVWMKLLILMKQDYFILTAYSLERPPKALLVLRGNVEALTKAWSELMDRAAENPHALWPIIVEPTLGERQGGRTVEFVDLSYTAKDIDFISFREEVRRTVGAIWGVMPIFSGDTSAGVGLANEGLQIVVTNRAVEREQALLNEKFLEWLRKQLGVSDWQIFLVPNEGRDVVARLQRERMRIDNAMLMAQLGYRPVAVKTEDGIDFTYESAEGSQLQVASPIRVEPQPILSEADRKRRDRMFEGEPMHGRPRESEQRFEGEELGRRPKKETADAFVVVEGSELTPVEQGLNLSSQDEATYGGLKNLYLTLYTDELDDFEVVKAGWQLGVKRYKREANLAGIVGYEEWPQYSGLSKEKSIEINNWLWDEVFAGRFMNLETLKKRMSQKFDLDEDRCELIIRTELGNMFNKMREWAYENETYVSKFVWKTLADACEKCMKVAERSARGVSLAELKQIIKEVGGVYSREWTVHPDCRCTFVRKHGKPREWERV